MLGPEVDIIQRAVGAGDDAVVVDKHASLPHAAARRTLNDAAMLGPRSAAIAANPPELRFDTFAPGQPCVQTVQLCNTSTAATRVTVLPPGTQQCFKVVRGETCGRLAPGMSLRLALQCVGGGVQPHCDDALHVLTEDGGLLVPLRAQPTSISSSISNTLPRHLELGCVALGESASAELPLVNPSAAACTFRVSIQQHNSCFDVAPLDGTVPAGGRAAVCVTFLPTRYSTERLQLQVMLATADAGGGAHVTVTGSARPGVLRRHMLEAAAAQAATLPPLSLAQQDQHDQRQWQARRGRGVPSSPNSHPRSSSSSSSSPKQRSNAPSKLPPVLLAAPVVVSARITQHDVNSLLNQRPNRLQVKDVKAAILQHKQQLASQQQRLQACLKEAKVSSMDPLDWPDLGDDVKEALFDMQLREATAGARCGTGSRLGGTPPTAEDVERVHQARQAALEAQEAEQRGVAARRLHTVKVAQGAMHVLGSDSYAGLDGFQPQWLLAESTDCRKRIQAAQRFVHAARVVLLRVRATKRLQQLKRLTAGLDTRGDAASQGWDATRVLDAGGGSSSVPPGPLPPELVRLCELPSWPEVDQQQQQRQLVAVSHIADFAALQPVLYEAQFEWRLLGYTAEDIPALMPYVAACDDQPLLPYASDDGLAVLPWGMLPPCLADAMPARLYAPMVDGSSSTAGTPQELLLPAASPSCWGGNPEAKLPRQPWAVQQLTSTPGAASLLEVPF